MIGSLYSSEIAKLEICKLCWYQRMCMFPLAVVLTVGMIRREKSLASYVLPFSITGFVIGIYHFITQRIEEFAPLEFCGAEAPPCDGIEFEMFGFVTLSLLSAIAFALITALVIFSQMSRKTEVVPQPSDS